MSEFQVTLPSRGLLYLKEDKESSILPGGVVSLKSMTAREQGILYNPGGDPTSKFDQILTNCLINSPQAASKYLITDRLYMMLILRTRSLGGVYKVPMRCSSCRTQYRHEVDLANDLKMSVYEDPMSFKEDSPNIKAIGNMFKEPFVFRLPEADKEIEYRLLRGEDEKVIATQAKRILMQSTDQTDPSHILRLSLMIQKVDGVELNSAEKLMFIQDLDFGDISKFDRDVEDHESGLDLTILCECRSCGYTEEVGMPFTAEFFRPSR